MPAGELVADMRAADIEGCVVNATQESDWQAAHQLAVRFPNFIRPAYGIHPWFADTATDGWDERLRQRLLAESHASIGEAGVDGWAGKPEMDIQRRVFMRQVDMAAELGRNITIHCLRAWEELFSLMDTAERWPEKFLMHSFGGSSEVARQLVKRGAWFSFSGYFLHPKKRKVLEAYKQIPRNRILLETDAPEMMPPETAATFRLPNGVNHPANLGSVAKAFEREIGGDILEQIADNGREFWRL